MIQLTDASLDAIANGGRFLRFRDGDAYNLSLVRIDFDRCEWVDVRMKDAKFDECHLQHSRFRDCYLRKAEFNNVDLTGTRFLNCDLSHARFAQCRLWYVDFQDCELDYDNIIKNSPSEINLRRRLLQSLRRNAAGRGEGRMANRLLLLEMAARRLEERSTFLASTDYFRENFTFEERLKAFFRWVLHWVELAIWGYGVRLSALLRSAILILLAGAVISWLLDALYLTGSGTAATTLSFPGSLYAAVDAFCNLGDLPAGNPVARVVRTALSLTGGIFLGLFAAAAYRRIER